MDFQMLQNCFPRLEFNVDNNKIYARDEGTRNENKLERMGGSSLNIFCLAAFAYCPDWIVVQFRVRIPGYSGICNTFSIVGHALLISLLAHPYACHWIGFWTLDFRLKCLSLLIAVREI